MRRSLVLTDETARHPFRASLPPHVRQPEESAKAILVRKPARRWGLTMQDLRDFMTAYSACLVAALIFVA